jgi:hypothetical protein
MKKKALTSLRAVERTAQSKQVSHYSMLITYVAWSSLCVSSPNILGLQGHLSACVFRLARKQASKQ